MSSRIVAETALVDTNVLLDMALEHRPEADAARALLAGMLHHEFGLCVSACSLKDFYYVAGKSLGEPVAREWVSFFLDELEVCQVDSSICRSAVTSDEPDFEDGIIRAVAERNGAGAIISRDENAFSGSLIRRLSARDFIGRLSSHRLPRS